MAFGIGKVQTLTSSLNDVGSAFTSAGSKAKTAAKQFQGTNDDLGDVLDKVESAQMALKYLRRGWGFLLAGAAKSSESLREDLDSLDEAYGELQETMGSAVAPAFELVAEVLTDVLQLLNEHETLAKGLGIAMAGLLSILSVLAAEYAALNTVAFVQKTLIGESTLLTKANTAAKYLWAKATKAVTIAKKFLVSTLTKENLLKAASAAKSAALTAAEFGLAAAKWALAGGAVAASAAVGLLGAALTALGIGPILMLVGALITGLALLADHFGLIDLDPVVAGLESLMGTLGSLVPSVDQITALLGNLLGFGGKPTGMMEWAQTLLSVLFPIIPITRAVLKHFGMLDDVGAILKSAVAGAMGFVNSLLGGVKRLVSNPKETLAAFASAGLDFVKTMAEKIAMAGPKFLRSAVDSALSAVIPFLPSSDAQRGPLSNLTGAGAALVKTIAQGILGAPGAIASAIGSALSGALGGLGKAALSIGSEIANGIADGIGGAAGAIGGAVTGAVDAAKGVADAAGGVVSGAANAVGGAVSGAADAASSVGNAVGSAGQAAGNVVGSVGDAASGLLGGGGGGGGKTQKNDTKIHFHGEVHDAQKIDQKVRKAQRQAVQRAHGGIEDALSMGKDATDSLI